jgi:N-formylglutamate deformylase
VTDDAFLAAFQSCTLPEAAFDHRAHVRLAWLQVGRLGVDAALDCVSADIQRYAASVGAAQIFHATLTAAAVRVVADGWVPDQSFEAFLMENSRVLTDLPGLVHRHYSPALLATPLAKVQVVAPDRDPLPDTLK